MKKKIRIVTDENGITWRQKLTKSSKGEILITSTKIGGFRRKITLQNSMVSQD